MGSARAELARRVLEALALGDPVPFHDAIQLRNWAVRPEDAMLPLSEVARGILDQEKKPNANVAENSPLKVIEESRRAGAEFLITDVDVALTFLSIARTSHEPESVQRNLKNARTAYDTILRLMPRAKFTKDERRAIHDKLATLKKGLEEFKS